ncbi:MAG TPA: 2-hydroxychromene-2-carboxylate isomerase [Candidatus Binatia bacterium]|nr:2-hydroxychromene-2-carboxylate isomerase [Candidatus Binatia bacterium]
MNEAPTVAFWFDFASTYSYPAAMRIEDAAQRYGCHVQWRPFLLGPIFKAQGWPDSPFNVYPVKGRYMWRDLERLCEGLQIPFCKPLEFPRRSLLATRVACVFEEADWVSAFAKRVYIANFAGDSDIAEPAVLLECLNGLVEDPEAILRAAHSQEAKARVRRNTEEAIRLGIFGAPTFLAGNEMFWGNDRLEAALQWSCK